MKTGGSKTMEDGTVEYSLEEAIKLAKEKGYVLAKYAGEKFLIIYQGKV